MLLSGKIMDDYFNEFGVLVEGSGQCTGHPYLIPHTISGVETHYISGYYTHLIQIKNGDKYGIIYRLKSVNPKIVQNAYIKTMSQIKSK
jgi:hypothetical protein